MQLFYSFIIPVYNRPNEVQELLESFTQLITGETILYEIIIVEDGSTTTSKTIVDEYKSQLPLHYLYKENSGPGDSRNYGMKHAQGNYFIILDSDVVLPTNYLLEVDNFLNKTYVDCFGGPDAADKNFTSIQKAINFVMTSFMTTGGIRGNKKAVKKFEPRSFNMGISKSAFEKTQGFGKIHPGEDPDLTIRIEKNNFRTALIPRASVYHKRRIDWGKFYIQVNKFGKVRPILTAWHPDTASVAFWFPSLFTVGLLLSIIVLLVKVYIPISFYVVYLLMVFIGSSIQNKSVYIGILSVRAILTQFLGYGLGFLKSTYYIRLRKKSPRKVFPELFFD